MPRVPYKMFNFVSIQTVTLQIDLVMPNVTPSRHNYRPLYGSPKGLYLPAGYLEDTLRAGMADACPRLATLPREPSRYHTARKPPPAALKDAGGLLM